MNSRTRRSRRRAVALLAGCTAAITAAALVGPGMSPSAARPTSSNGHGHGHGNSLLGAAAAVNPTFPIRTRVIASGPGKALAVTVGDVTHHAPAAADWTCPTGVWVLALDRDTLDEKGSNDYPLCSAADADRLADALKQLPSTYSVVVNSVNRSPGQDSRTLPELQTALAEIGAPDDEFAELNLAQTGFSVYGISGLPAGQAYTATDSLAGEAAVPAGMATVASINGTLARDNHSNFSMTMPDFALYDIAADGAITVDDHVYPVPARPAGFKGGFHVLVVDRRTLDPISDTLYSTNDNPREQYRLGSDLAKLRADRGQSVLVFLATLGSPVGGRQLPTGPRTFAYPCTASGAYTVNCVYKAKSWESKGLERSFYVPAEVVGYPVTSLHVSLTGGYGGYAKSGGQGGNPDEVTAELPVGPHEAIHPDQTLYLEVGQAGTSGGDYPGGLGGWNGGADGGSSPSSTSGWPGGGGGGASDIRTISLAGGNTAASLRSRIAVAAGGGGAGGDAHRTGHGGDGGDAGSSGHGGDPGSQGGGAGTSTHGGAPGGGGTHGGVLGTGGLGYDANTAGGAGGGGGGGYYGGGAGGVDSGGGGGGAGGGSDLVPAGGTARLVAGAAVGHTPANVSISYTVPYGTLAQALRPFGGTPNIVADLAKNPRYALVGALGTPKSEAAGLSPDSPEASTVIDRAATGQLQGVLQRGNQEKWYSSITSNAPAVVSVNGKPQSPSVANYGLYRVVSKVDADWPVPVAGAHHAAQQKALTYLSQETCGGCTDIRDEYNASEETVDTWRRDMATKTFKSGRGFGKADFDVVKKQLLLELRDVYVVAGLKNGLHAMLGDKQLLLQPALTGAFSDVSESVEVAENAQVAPAVKFILEMMGTVAEVAFEATGVGAAFGVANAAYKLGTELTNEANGAAKEDLKSTAAKLGQDTAESFTASLSSLSQTFGYIYGNWGKLAAVADGMTRDNKHWDINTRNAAVYVVLTAAAAKLGYYRSLVGVTYQRFEAQGAPTADLERWCLSQPYSSRCDYAGDKTHDTANYGFAYPTSAYTFAVQNPPKDFAPRHDNILVTVKTGSTWNSVQPLSEELMNKMEESGLYAPYLFLRWPMVKGLVCPENFQVYATTASTSTGTVFGCTH